MIGRKSMHFYKELTAEGLAERKNKIETKLELRDLKKILKKDQKILDLACGYGRFTIPLAKQGYLIGGIDITPILIKSAKSAAKKVGLGVDFRIGDMIRLPYKNESFGAIICMWSAFSELYKERDQSKAVREMLRVLKKGGGLLFLKCVMREWFLNIIQIRLVAIM